MYLDQVEIHGFKSFGDAVKLNIPKGITGVIGPNGSGKSNVSDAIRWVLGEQSAKSLRGSKMEDIIFAGTEKRKSLGYAEVALKIKNPDQKVAIDYTEIVVKRRVYRSGESEYFINGSPCRLKDVQELFMDTGVGKEGYSIIGQGQIDRVLSSKPEERRTLFEEAAGIYKYKMRRIEAERKLEKQRENLTRLQDIIGEIETRIGPLEIEAEKTKQFLKLKEELKEVDINIFIYEMDRLEKEIQELTEKIGSVDVELKEYHQLQVSQVSEQEQLKLKRDQIYREAEAMIEKISTLEKEKERRQGQIALNHEKVSSTVRLLEQVRHDQKEQVADHQSKKDKISFLETKRTALEIEKASKESIINQEEEKIKLLEEKLEELSSHIDESKTALHQKLREIDLFEADIQKNDGVEEQLEFRKEQIKEQISRMNSEIQHQEVSVMLIEKKQKEGKEKLCELKETIEKLGAKKEELLVKKTRLEKEMGHMSQNVAQTERQLKWLNHIKEENEGYFGSVKQVLNVVKSDKARWKGIIGVVGELLEVPKDYEIAIVTALGGAIQNIVTSSEQDAKDMIQLMKQRGISRVTFLPLDTVRPSTPVQEKSMLNEKGYLGLASELIQYDEQYKHIISSLLGRIIIVDDMHNASRIAKHYGYKYKLVTLQGEVFNSGGSLSGGSTKNQANNLFSRARELKETEEKLKQWIANKEETHKALTEVASVLEEVEADYKSAYEDWSHLNDEDKSLALELDKNNHALKLNKANQLQFITERNNIEESIDEINRGKEEAAQKLEKLKSSISVDEEAIGALEENLKASRVEREALDRQLTDKRIGLSSTIQNISYMLDQIKELQDAINSHDTKRAQLNETIEKYEAEIRRLKEETLQIEMQIKQDECAIEDAQLERKGYDEKKIQLEHSEKQLEQKVNQVNEKVGLLKEEKYRLESRKENSLMQKQNGGNTMWEQYEMTYTHALAYKRESIQIPELKRQSLDLKGRIKQIGNVNVNAVEEYNETKTRYEFLLGQKEDIEKAAETLVEMIDKLLEEMKDIFRAQFAIIARNFTEVFKELFGGGEAYLELVDEENILESGIEIVAKPPGKKLQNMSLLSGGERTLTAISLIFGILKLKPSPFCVLDEIEAALDDANVIRFANYLEKLSSETQFIVITHRKGTMERAHTLYGVTQQERGVSTILSIQLGDVDQYMDKKKSS
ncbi:MAG: chromosome segregation protein SMC [Cellulosilyticum sp.]|nr:chromosome segregation protein SMC [Cellulosilyticum sp.]